MMTLHLRVRRQGQVARLCGIELERIEQFATVSCVPGSLFGMALVRSQIIPVLRLGDVDSCLVVGRVRGEVFGIIGLDILGLEREELTATESLAASDGPLATDAKWRNLANDSHRSIEGDYELDVDELITNAKTQQRYPSQLSEERS